jgi:hypothetical protein
MEKDTLDLFVEKLVVEKQFPELDEDVMAEIKADLRQRAERQINGAILAAMPPEKLEEFDKVTDSGNDEEIQKFCSDNIPNVAEVTAQALINFRNSYLGV